MLTIVLPLFGPFAVCALCCFVCCLTFRATEVNCVRWVRDHLHRLVHNNRTTNVSTFLFWKCHTHSLSHSLSLSLSHARTHKTCLDLFLLALTMYKNGDGCSTSASKSPQPICGIAPSSLLAFPMQLVQRVHVLGIHVVCTDPVL